MRFAIAAALLLCIAGCARGPTPPAVGAKVVMPKFRTAYATPDLHGGRRLRYPDYVQPGALVEVLEVGEGYAAIEVIRDAQGGPGNLQGFVERWW